MSGVAARPIPVCLLVVLSLAGACGTPKERPVGAATPGGGEQKATESAERDPGIASREMRRQPPERVAPTTSESRIAAEVPSSILEAIYADLEERAGVFGETPELLGAEAVIWPDGSLGCALPDEVYTQAIVPGYRIELELAGRRYDYRASEQGRFRLCTLEPSLRKPDR